jgi:hypothetical protein
VGSRPVELVAPSASANNEIRANYGGMHLAMSALFAAGAMSLGFRWAATVVLMLFSGGLVAGRLVSIALDGPPNGFVIQLLITEATAAGAGAALLWAARTEAKRGISMSGQWTTADIPDLSGKTIIVTGGNGVGSATTRLQLAAKNARVVLACRDQGRASTAADAILVRRSRTRPST